MDRKSLRFENVEDVCDPHERFVQCVSEIVTKLIA